MNAKNLPLKFAFLALIVALCVWSMMAKKLRLGIDLRGGHAMIFEIKTSDAEVSRLKAERDAKVKELDVIAEPNRKAAVSEDIKGLDSRLASLQGPDDTRDLPDRMIKILKGRVDPLGTSSLEWRPLGANRIEVRMPAGSDDSKKAKQAYDDALRAVEAGNLKKFDLWQVVNLRGPEREACIAKIAGGNKPLADLLARYGKANDDVAAAKAQVDGLRASSGAADALEKAQAALEDAQATLFGLEPQLSAHNINPASLENLFRNYVSPQEAATMKKDEVQRRRELFDIGLKKLTANHADRVEKIDSLVTSYKRWVEVRRQLDDPSDLIRLIRNAGVLEFRIAPRVGDLSQGDVRYYTDILQNPDQGPDFLRRQNAAYLWLPVKSGEDRYTDLVMADLAGKTYVLLSNKAGEAMLQNRGEGGWALRRAYVGNDQYMQPAVDFEFNENGAKIFGDLTHNHLKKPMAILLDDEIYSIPEIQSRISDRGQITGRFTSEDVQFLAQILEAGSLPARLNPDPVAINTFGPSFGEENLNSALRAGYYSCIVVVAFMLVYYMLAGVIANIALALNILLVLGAMSMLGAVFTLPGIAGVILTVGMAVDANVLIYERLREEQAKGLSIRMALKNAYERAFSAIFDSNITTLISALILFWIGSEEVKGFAITLGLGVAFNIFTAVYVTRWVFQVMIEAGLVKKHFTMMRMIGVPNVDWMRKRYYFWAFSLVTAVMGMASLVTEGRNILGIEFSSGTQATLVFKDDALIDGDLPNDGSIRELFIAKSAGNQKLAASRVEKIDTNRVSNFMRDHDVNGDKKVTAEEWKSQGLNPKYFELMAAKAKDKDGLTLPELDRCLPANTYQVATTEANVALIQKVADEAFPGAMVKRQRLDFDLVAGKQEAGVPLAADGRTMITKKIALSADAAFQRDLLDAEDGVLLVVKLRNPVARTEIAQRIREMRFQPDFANVSMNSADVLGIGAPAGEDTFSQYAVIVAPGDPAMAGNPKAWNEFAARELALATEALHRQEAIVATNFDAAVAGEASQRAVMALILGWLAIIVYLWVRFGQMRWGLAAVLCLVHDVTIIVGLVAASTWLANTLLGKYMLIEPFKIDLAMVAALLTIIGYSVNDTIVVFDRIRENRGKLITVTPQVINLSVNQTLSRTILTGLTTITTVFIMYVWGGQGIHSFNFALFVGILFGTYSSIAVAAPMLLGFKEMVIGRAIAQDNPTAK